MALATSTILAGIGLAVGVAGTVAQISSSRRAAREQRKARAEQRKVQAERTRRSRVQALRQAQIQRARALSTGVGIGAGDTSGLAGGVSSLSSQTGAALGSASQLSGLARNISIFNQNAADAQSRAGTFGSIAGLGFSATNFALSNRRFLDGGTTTVSRTPVPQTVPARPPAVFGGGIGGRL